MIRSFRDTATERLYRGEVVKRFGGIRTAALRKLDMRSEEHTSELQSH